MSPNRLVISVSGGIVEDVLTDLPDLEVILCDWDVDGLDDQDLGHIVRVEQNGVRHSVFVAPFTTSLLPTSPNSLVGQALGVAGYDCQTRAHDFAVQLSDRELATVLAALRCWQSELFEFAQELTELSPYFEEHTPLTAEEIDALCERMNVLSLH